MKKVLAFLLVMFLSVGVSTVSTYAQDSIPTEQVDSNAATTAPVTEEPVEQVNTQAEPEAERTAHQDIKKKFIEGGWEFMAIVLICLILGLAVAIERIITLSLATVNTKKLLAEVESCIKSGNVEGAKNICKSTAGPTAEVLGEGLRRVDDGLEAVEKAVISNGSVQMGLLEKGIVWLALFIALAPMLGFMGTVLGMIEAFDTIEKAGDIQPSMVAGGIKVALLTTVFGLITAIILQIFYNFIMSKVDSLVNGMEDATIGLVDILIDNKHVFEKKEA